MGRIMNMRMLILLAASLASSQAWAGNVTIPNTFVNGTTASAGEVNANFNAVKLEVNDNNARINTNTADIQTNAADVQTNSTNIGINTSDISTNAGEIQANASAILNNTNSISSIQPSISLIANGAKIGTFLAPIYSGNANSYYALSQNGYLFGINVTTHLPDFGKLMYLETTGSSPSLLLYELPNCQGQAYILSSDLLNTNGVGVVAHGTGIVFNMKGDVLYVPKNVSPVTVTYLSSQTHTTSCNSGTGTIELLPVNLNDPVITGVSLVDFPQPLSLGR